MQETADIFWESDLLWLTLCNFIFLFMGCFASGLSERGIFPVYCTSCFCVMCVFLRLKERDLKYSALEERGIFQVIRAWNGLFNSSGLSYWLTGKCRHSLREWSLVADIVQFHISVYGLFCVRAFRTRHISCILYFMFLCYVCFFKA